MVIYTICDFCKTIGTRKAGSDISHEKCKVCGKSVSQIKPSAFDHYLHFRFDIPLEPNMCTDEFTEWRKKQCQQDNSPISNARVAAGDSKWII